MFLIYWQLIYSAQVHVQHDQVSLINVQLIILSYFFILLVFYQLYWSTKGQGNQVFTLCEQHNLQNGTVCFVKALERLTYKDAEQHMFNIVRHL